MADHNPSTHAEAHRVHGQDLKPEHKSEVVKTEASTSHAGEHEGASHDAKGKENHSHGKLAPLGINRGPPTSQTSKGGKVPVSKPPTSGPKEAKLPQPKQQGDHECDSESESDKSSDGSDDSDGGSEHTADMKKRGKIRGKPAPSTTKGGGGAPSGPPKGAKR